jgi:histidine phosphotransfer protein HptB
MIQDGKPPSPFKDPSESPSPSSIPGLNLQHALSGLNGKWARLHRLLRSFAGEYRGALLEIDALLNHKDFEKATALLHTVKGATGMLGAHRLHMAIQAVEAEVKSGQVPPPSWGEFREAMRELLDGIQSLDDLPGDEAR